MSRAGSTEESARFRSASVVRGRKLSLVDRMGRGFKVAGSVEDSGEVEVQSPGAARLRA